MARSTSSGASRVVDLVVHPEGEAVVAPRRRHLLAHQQQHAVVPALVAIALGGERVVVGEHHHVDRARRPARTIWRTVPVPSEWTEWRWSTQARSCTGATLSGTGPSIGLKRGSPRQLRSAQRAAGRLRDARDLPPGRAPGTLRRRTPAVLAEGAAGEPAAPRGRARRHGAGHREPRDLGGLRRALARDRVHARARADAGLHRRSGDRGPGRHARRDGGARRRSRARSTRSCRSSS